MTGPGMQGPLGIGEYRVYVYDRGAVRRIGEITPIAALTWSRDRDDISSATLTTAGFGEDCCDLLGSTRAMRHELVIFRDGVRVWEGPITRIGYSFDSVEIAANDVMQYVYRRILREGYDDRYPNQKTVVDRAYQVIQNALVRDDPNVIQYIVRYDHDDDASQTRLVYPFQKTAWEEVDDLAAKAGLDYTVLGRSIILNDVHNSIADLPPMDDSSFMAHPIITEYGQDLVTFSASTDGNGYYGTAGAMDPYYGLVEILASSYSNEGPPDELGPTQEELARAQAHLAEAQYEYDWYPGLTYEEEVQLSAYYTERNTPGVHPDRQKELDALIYPLQLRKNTKLSLQTQLNHAQQEYDALVNENQAAYDNITAYINALTSQAQRNLRGHNPTPVVVRIPDGSRLNPNVYLGINQLVPGAWALLRSMETCREMSQWQKLDKVVVTVRPGDEEVAVTFSPAPAHRVPPEDTGEPG